MTQQPAAHVVLAVGGVLLVAWYGWRRWRGAPVRSGTQDPEAPQRAAAAWAAEFRPEPPGDFPGGSVVCPACGVQHPAGRLFCDCGAETVDPDDAEEGAPEPTPAPPAEDRLLCVHVAENAWTASLLRSFLDSHGIPSMASGNLTTGFSHFSRTPLGEVRIYVRAEDAEEARRLLSTAR